MVLCQIPRAGYPSAARDSQAASTTGKYSGRQPAMAALIAASRTVQCRFRCGMDKTTSSAPRLVWARNPAR